MLLPVSISSSQEPKLHLITESKYFSVYAYKNFNIESLLTKLNFDYFPHIRNLSGKETSRDLKTILANTLDAMFLEVSDILDIHIYSFHGTIKLVPNQNSVNAVFKGFFGNEFPERSFYLHERNTIYISSADLTLGMLGHETAHAIISHYFVVPPPIKIQEVLAGYVEYNLRKSRGTLR